MPSVELARLPETVAQSLVDGAVAAGHDGFRVYDRDRLPAAPVEPYAVIDAVPTGFGWDPTLTTGTVSGVVAYQVTAVGRLRSQALWVLDVIRRATETLVPSDLTLTGTTVATSVPWSTGTPTTPIGEGGIWSATETYHLHVEAQ